MVNYPCGIDCEWLATDHAGRLAAMITAGEAPIPSRLLAGTVEIQEIGDLLLALPRIAGSDQRVMYPDMSSIDELSERGFYVYDWSDVHRTSGKLAAYELIAIPTVALRLERLPPDLRALAQPVDVPFSCGEITLMPASDWVKPQHC